MFWIQCNFDILSLAFDIILMPLIQASNILSDAGIIMYVFASSFLAHWQHFGIGASILECLDDTTQLGNYTEFFLMQN